MPEPYVKLWGASGAGRRVTAAAADGDSDGETHEDCEVKRSAHVRTSRLEVWEFVPDLPPREVRLFGLDLGSVELHWLTLTPVASPSVRAPQ